jgi:hypothetical protein
MHPSVRARILDASAGRALALTDLAALGISASAAERAVRAGEWQRLVPGLYLPHARPLTPVELAREGTAYVGSPCVVTGLVACHRYRLRWLPPADEVHLLVADEVRRSSAGPFVVQRTPQWDAAPVSTLVGLRWAAPDRAVVDACRRAGSLREARGLVLGAVADRLVTPEHLAAALATCRRNGSAYARRAIVDATRGCASPPEAELVDALLLLGRPFLVNPEVWVSGILIGCPDTWVLGTGVGGEVESRERHAGDDLVESTYDRHERFAAVGLDLVHLSVARIRRDPHEAARHLLQRAGARAGTPPGLVVVARGPVLGGCVTGRPVAA